MIRLRVIEEKIIPSLLLLAIFLLPLTNLGTIEVGFTIKPSEIFFGFGLLTLLYVRLRKRDFSFQKTPLDLPLFGLVGFFAVSLLAATNLERGVAFWFWTIFSIVSIYYFSVNILYKNEKLFKLALVVLVISTLFSVLFGFYQFVGDYVGWSTGLRSAYVKELLGFPRIQSTLLEPLYFGNFLLTSLPILIALFVTGFTQFIGKRMHVVVLIFLFMSALILTLSRGAWIGFTTSVISLSVLLLALIFIRRGEFKKILKPKNFFAFIPVLVLLSLLFSVGLMATAPLLSGKQFSFALSVRTATSGIADRTIDITKHSIGRFEAYKIAVDFVKENPYIGVGLGNFGPRISGDSEGITGYTIVNNLHLEILTETGIFGFFFYIWLVLALVFTTLKTIFRLPPSKKVWVVILIGLLSAYTGIFVQQMTYSTLNITFFWFLLALIISAQKLATRG